MGGELSTCGFATPGSPDEITRVGRRKNRSIEQSQLNIKRQKKSTSVSKDSPEAMAAHATPPSSPFNRSNTTPLPISTQLSQQHLDNLTTKSTQINYDVKELLDMFREGMKLLDSTEVQNQSVNQKTAATATARRQTSKDNINKFIDSNQTLAKIRERNAVKGLLAQWEKTAGAPKPTTPGPLAAAAGSTPTKRVEQSPVRQSSTDCMAFDEDDEDEEYVPIEIVYLEKLLQLHEDLTEVAESIETIIEVQSNPKLLTQTL